MSKGRLDRFTDGVIAIIITILVLEFRPPHGEDLEALRPLIPTALSYVLSFAFVAIYWNNHHHLLHAVHRVDGRVLWANIHLLFWLSLTPFTTAWMGDTHWATLPVATYGIVLFMTAIAFTILVRALIARHGPQSTLARAIGADRKGLLSLILYGLSIPVAFANRWVSLGIYVTVALIWLIPDSRIERVLMESGVSHQHADS